MSYPKNLSYTKDHEWLQKKDSSTALVGVTAFAVEQLGDIVHLDLPKVGDELDSGAPFGTIESTKTVSDLYAPISGKVVEINEGIKNNLESLASDPYENGWLIKLQVKNPGELDGLLSADQYGAFISEQGG